VATKKIKVSFARLRCLRNSAVFGAARWSFTATVDGQKVGDPKKRHTVKPGTLVPLSWSHEVDVTGKKGGEFVEVVFRAEEHGVIFKPDQGTVRLKFNYPFQRELEHVFFGSPGGIISKTQNFMLTVKMEVTDADGTAPDMTGVPTGKKGAGDTVTTVAGAGIIPRVEISPVVPVLQGDQVPPRPDFDAIVPHGKDTKAAKPVKLAGSLDLNTLPNPALIPVIKPTEKDFKKRCARLAVTHIRPHQADTSQLRWVVKKGSVQFHGETRGREEVLAYGTAESDEPAEIELRWGEAEGPLLCKFRAWVGKIKYIPTRATLVAGSTAGATPRATAADIHRHIQLANVLMYQAGLLLVPDHETETWDGATASVGNPGVYTIKTADNTLTVGVNDNIPPHPMRLNFRPGAMHLVYIKSLSSAGAAGVAVDRPGLAGDKVSIEGTPSTSWVPPTGVAPDKASAKVTMKTMPKSDARTSQKDKDYAKARKTLDASFPDDAYDKLFGCIMPDYTPPSDEDWPQTLAHEVGHVLGLRHRGNPQTDPAKGKVGSNDEVNGNGGKGHPWLENVMSYGYTQSQDFDLLQTRVIRKHPSVIDEIPKPKPPKPKPVPSNDKLKDLQKRLGVAESGEWDDATEQAASGKMVRNGSRGEVVEWVQTQLNAQGMNSGTVDGIAGQITVGAIRRWQDSRDDLSTDGIAGPRTMQTLAES
jgi:hypothetical protein